MLNDLGNYLVAWLKYGSRKAVSDQIKGFGGSPDKDDLSHVFGFDKVSHGLAGLFVFICGQFGNRIQASKNIGAVLLIILSQAVNDYLRFKRCGRTIQVN